MTKASVRETIKDICGILQIPHMVLTAALAFMVWNTSSRNADLNQKQYEERNLPRLELHFEEMSPSKKRGGYDFILKNVGETPAFACQLTGCTIDSPDCQCELSFPHNAVKIGPQEQIDGYVVLPEDMRQKTSDFIIQIRCFYETQRGANGRYITEEFEYRSSIGKLIARNAEFG